MRSAARSGTESHGRSIHAALLVLAVIACDGEPAGHVPELRMGTPITVADVLSGAAGGVELFRPTGIAAAGSGLLVLDAGNHRVLRLDEQMREVGRFGAEGKGPGEIRFPFGIVVRGDTAAIADIGNGRILLVDWHTGREVRTHRADTPPQTLAWLEDGSFLIPGSSKDHYLTRIGPDDAAAPFAQRPEAPLAKRDAPGEALVAGCGAGAHVFDDETGNLLRYSLDGRLLEQHALPAALHADLVREREEVVGAFQRQGIRVVGRSLVKQLAAIDCSSVIVLFAHSAMFGVWVDHAAGSARPLLLPDREPWRSVLRRAMVILPRRSGAIVLSDDELFTVRFVPTES